MKRIQTKIITAILAGAVGTFLALAAHDARAADTPPPDSVMARIASTGQLKVCIWPDYYGITFRNPRNDGLSGIDVDLSAELARELKVKLQYVDSSFPTLIDDLNSRRCDVAMFAVGMLPARVAQLAFSDPYLSSDIYAVTTRSNRVIRQWSDLDQPGVVIGVQAGTFMEPVMAASLKRATIKVVRPPETRERELEAGRIDAFMTDYPYSRRLLDNADWARLVAPPAPFHVLPYAYATRKGDEAWLARINAFVAAIKRDGRLRAAAQRHGLGEIVVR